MTAEQSGAIAHTAELIAHLARISFADGNCLGMTSAQWSTLRYFSRASRFSRTLSDFADYHATSRGSASQIVKGLFEKGLIVRSASQQDKRSSRIDLTEKGRDACTHDPFEKLVRAIASLPERNQNALTVMLEDVLVNIAPDAMRQTLGSCAKCEFLKERLENRSTDPNYFCTRAGADLLSSDLQDICMKYRPRSADGDWLG